MADGIRSSGPAGYLSFSLGEWTGLMLISGPYNGTLAAPPIPWEWLTQLISDRSRLPGVRILKRSETVEVFEARLPPQAQVESPQRVICKQTKLRGVRDRLTGFVRPTAARRNFERARILQNAGIGTALPLAFLERKSPRGSWLMTEFLDGVIDLDAYVLTVLSRAGSAGNRDRRNTVIRSLVDLFRGLASSGLYHRDMKASNILLVHADEQAKSPRACIVDLDGLAAYKPWRSAWKPIVRLAASLLQYPTVNQTDYARFLREYLIAGGQDRLAWRKHFLRLRKQAARYTQAAQKRKSNKLDGYAG